MTSRNNRPIWPFLFFVAFGPLCGEEALVLDTLTIQSDDATPLPGAVTSTETGELAASASGETLGDYLKNSLGVTSASYGPAVGRPVMNGLDGYRVGIVQGTMDLNDLSAMSQDHAVGLTPRASERIELIKGPASLLYGAYSGGVVRVLGEENLPALPGEKPLLHFGAASGDNGAGNRYEGVLKQSLENWGVSLSHHEHDADAYRSGEGEKVADSDLKTRQSHGVVGWKIAEGHLLKLYGDSMQKDYGIPNRTSAATRIDMRQERVGLVWHMHPNSETVQGVEVEIQRSDYLHNETEGGREDGLFGQTQNGFSGRAAFVWSDWVGEGRVSYLLSDLMVCHEHGKCQSFSTALRTAAEDGISLKNYYDSTGIAYSHGYPMPDTGTQTFKGALNLTRYLDASSLTIGAAMEQRRIDLDSDNIQETWLVPESVDTGYYDRHEDQAGSLSLGWLYEGAVSGVRVDLTLLSRLPSVQELYWNGFHHATDSYILGDRHLEPERSTNVDVAWQVGYGGWESLIEGYHYRFSNYIYQKALYEADGSMTIDPFHGSPVYTMVQEGADIYGMGIAESYSWSAGSHDLKASLQVDAVEGRLHEGGYLPRIPPLRGKLGLEHRIQDCRATLAFHKVAASHNEAVNESNTPGYEWISLGLFQELNWKGLGGKVWLKGENLGDKIAHNHLSFLKESAPLPGRQVTFGLDIDY